MIARRLLILLGFLFLSSFSARAQSGFDLFGGYTYERLGTSPARNLNGMEIAGDYKLKDWLGVTADLDTHFGLPSAPDARTFHLMAGPQVSLPGPISPFAHVLAGVGHTHFLGDTSTSFAGAIGGGIDMRIAPRLSWRIVQGDDVITRFFGVTQHSARISTGLVLHF